MIEHKKPVVEPTTQAFLDSLAARLNEVRRISLTQARINAISDQIFNCEELPAQTEDLFIEQTPGKQIEIRTVRPLNVTERLPVVMYFHGGGWVLNNKHAHDRLVREIAIGSRSIVVFVEYSRSPEARYPVAIEEAYAATKWVAENSHLINADGSRIAVAGDSSGGNMATVVTLMAKERGGPKISLQVLFSPVLDARLDTASYKDFSHGYFLTRKHMKWFWDQYAPDKSTRSEITASPLQATIEQLRGLPPALIITGELDVVRDEAEAYAHKLMQAGVEVTATRYLGTIHAFVFVNDLSKTPASMAAIEQTNAMLRKVLYQS